MRYNDTLATIIMMRDRMAALYGHRDSDLDQAIEDARDSWKQGDLDELPALLAEVRATWAQVSA